MIPTIGIVVACYVAVRMLQLLLPPGSKNENVVVKIAAGFTVLVAVVAIGSLLTSGQTTVR